jgi:hypothetical protein
VEVLRQQKRVQPELSDIVDTARATGISFGD